jgi:putative transposase
MVPPLTVLDLCTRESLALVADRSLTGVKVAAVLTAVLQRRRAPRAITVDNGSEFVSRAIDAWAYAHDVRLDFIRPGKPVENAFIERLNGKLRDECLNSHVFATVAEAQVVLDAWREDYGPHVSRMQSRTTGSNSRSQALQSRFLCSGFREQVSDDHTELRPQPCG